MKEINNKNFGLLIAFVLPGFTGLWGFQFVSPTVGQWLSVTNGNQQLPTIGGFLYATLSSLIVGMAISAVRFCTIDRVLAAMGLKRPVWNESLLQQNLAAFDALVENHYRHYQFYANMMIASALALGLHHFNEKSSFISWHVLILIVLEVVFGLTAHNTLKEYFRRTSILLSISRKDTDMANGHAPGSKEKPQDNAKPADKKPTDPASKEDQKKKERNGK